VLDAVDADRVAAVAISVTTMTAVRLAAEQPERVSHLIVAGGFTDFDRDTPPIVAGVRTEVEWLQTDYPEYLHRFFTMCFTEPHSTKQFEDAVRYAWATTSEVLYLARNGWRTGGVGELFKQIRPHAVIHGDEDGRVPTPAGVAVHWRGRIAARRFGGGGHLTAARDPVCFNRWGATS
jgi:pimeloyl-ACP methyl ester carboxylesterase